jgi:hypothetical protein
MDAPLIEIGFFKSRSKVFTSVASQAKCFDGFSEIDGKYSLSLYSLEELFTHPNELIYILGETLRWAGTTVRYNGVIVIDRPTMMAGKIKEILRCYSTYSGASDKRNFCNSTGNGCRRLENVSLNGINSYVFRRWYKFGYFENESKYIVDKPCLKELTAQEAEDRMLNLCPAFSLELVHTIIDLLPDSLDTNNGTWQVVYERILTEKGHILAPFSVELVDVFSDEVETAPPAPIKAEKPIHERSESEINEYLDSGMWQNQTLS